MKNLTELEPRTVTLLAAIAIGLGLVVHEVFFLLAIAIVVISISRPLYDYYKLTHHRP